MSRTVRTSSSPARQDSLQIAFNLPNAPRRRDQLNEYRAGLLVRLLRASTAPDLAPSAVFFEHPNSGDIKPVANFFGCPVHYEFGANVVELPRAELERPPTHRPITCCSAILSKALYSLFEEGADGPGLLSAVSREILQRPSMDGTSLEDVALSLAMTTSKLRKGLADEGFTFSDAKQRVRESRAKYLLTSTTMTLGQIAEEVGYSELSAFSRAFKSWTGHAPTKFRQTS